MNLTQDKTSIKPNELARRLAEGSAAVLLDVRTPGEFSAGHAPDAILMPLADLDAMMVRRLRDRQAGPVYLLCQTGGRARRAQDKLERLGVGDCVVVEGGMEAWVQAGLQVERKAGGGLPLMRQVQITVGAISATGAALALMVSSWFALIPLVLGCGLLFAGISGTCGLALLLAQMPWNRGQNGAGNCEISTGGGL